jgi:hypothetical protein
MTIAPGVRLGPFEILAPLRRGEMGGVWRVDDARLGRAVAIKSLPDLLSNWPVLLTGGPPDRS